MLRSISLRARLYWMCAAFVVGMVGIVGMEEATLRYAAVDGPVYVELVQDKDLLADILPPPLYALEARLVSARLAASPSAADIATLAARLQQLQDEYDSRADYWETTLPQDPIRTHVLGRARTESTRVFEAIRDHVLPAAQRGDFAEAARADRDEVEPAYAAHRAAIDTAVAQLNEQAQARAVAARATVHSRRVWTLALATLACAGVSALSVLTSRHVARGVSRNAEAIRAVEQRDLTVRVEPSGDDDLGRMGRALNRAVTGLRTVLGGFRSHAGDVAERAGTLRSVSRELTDRADAASRSSADVDRAMGEVTERLTRIAASAEQLRLAISEISRHSNEASTVASEGVRHVSESSEHMERLAASSSEVDAVVKAIGGVARQTSLLALNATIEAARAGESGQGFAVVANEVKDLARKAHAAAEDASSRIRAMQADTEGARRTLGAVRELVERIHEFQSSVAAAVTEQEATTSEIQRAVSEAAESSTHVGTTVRRLADASAATQSSAATTLAAAEALGVTAEELQTAAGQFRLEAA